MKKLACATALVAALTCGAVFAGGPTVEPMPEHHCSWTGFYAGLGVGGVFNDINATFGNTYASGGSQAAGLYKNAHLDGSSAMGNLFVGYGYDFDSFYLGAEAWGSYGQSDTTFDSSHNLGGTTITSSHAKVNLNSGEGGIDGRIGIFATPNNTLIYGRVGAAFNDITVFDNSAITSSGVEVAALNTNTSKSVTGLRLGLGMEEMLKGCFGVRMDYIYTDYGKFSPAVATTTSAFTITHSSSVDVSTNTVMGSFIYHFSA